METQDKFKYIVGFLALICLVSVLTFFKSFTTSSVITRTAGTVANSLSFAVDPDSDHDGLVDKEEDYWNTDISNPDSDGDGYRDGEEVASGHDPLIPGPNDFIASDKNLTDKLASLTVAGLYEGSLKPDNPDYNKSLVDMAFAVTDDAIRSLEFDLSTVKLKIIDSDKGSQEQYLRNFSDIFQEFSDTYIPQTRKVAEYLDIIGNSGFSDKSLVSQLNTSISSYKTTYAQLIELPIPKKWQSIHLTLIKFIGNLIQTNQVISEGKDDPVKAAAGLNRLISLWDVYIKTSSSYADKVKAENLNTAETIF